MKTPQKTLQQFAANAPQGRIAFVIPTLNEARHIRRVITALLGSAECLEARIFVADGGSTDGTRDLVAQMASQHPRIVLLHNPKRQQAAAVNLVVAQYGGQLGWILRVDAHADYPRDYADVLLAEADRHQADSVVVRMQATPAGRRVMERNIAAAQNALFGNGGSAHRGEGQGRYVDHGHHALMRVDAFRSVGGYDETFSHAEDVELDQRLVKAGHRIWLTGATEISYYPRRSLTQLALQYYRFGAGRSANFRKHPDSLQKRHFILLSLAPIALLGLLSPFEPLLTMPTALWLFACLTAGVLTAWRSRQAEIVLCGLAGAVMQLAWSCGFWGRAIHDALQASDIHAVPGRLPTAEDEK
ncbi:glycosyltransferase family 2 protein [Sulfitobacter dubius]|uniref:glycosyltransferase family 2 protein n=1 Tax=Sulfitobacter dubius TaxID=218673 RepID=UPI0008E4537B|nr:glycosyltransferase family 2 protein [Sulfitobacter dubius]SFH10929.1 succinoglycan biosynthesis protein ExoA [Sulfitobacter dubius]